MSPARGRLNGSAALDAEHFLRSVNICYDATEPARIEHFRPTSKSTALVERMLAQESDRAFLITAPYGSGKSLTLAYVLHLIENRKESQDALRAIEHRMADVSDATHSLVAGWRRRNSQGLVMPLHGHCPDLPRTIKRSALDSMARLKMGREAKPIEKMPSDSIDDAVKILLVVQEKCRSKKLRIVSLLWDEVGRHIEALVSEGRTSELGDIQTLAEVASRSTTVPFTFAVALHQGLLHYASQMAQSVRLEWMKISGRFQEVQYTDDSREIYRLIGEVVSSRRETDALPTKAATRRTASLCRNALGLFEGMSIKDVDDLLRSAYPLDPVSLYLLPRLSARVAQHERTLFTFLYQTDLSSAVTVERLYDYFSSAMRADTAVGGTYRQWLETESALSKATDDPKERTALKAACLLGLGTGGERSRASADLVIQGLAGYGDPKPWREAVKALISRNLLLHRKHNDELSVWHGTDVDLRGRLEEEKSLNSGNFNLKKFLSREASPKPWKPLRHNSLRGVCRHWDGVYLGVDDIHATLDGHMDHSVPIGCDGRMLYVLAEDEDHLSAARKMADRLDDPRLIVVLPREPLQVREAALETYCLGEMLHSRDLSRDDPLAVPELRQMMDDARVHLHRVLDRLVNPSAEGPDWYYRGQPIAASSPSRLRAALSDICDEVFHLTPEIRNELIVRRKPSGTIINSRKKLLLGMLDRHGQESLAIRGNFPDFSMFRTVLLHTGLYREQGGRWDYPSPACTGLPPGVAAVWETLREFFSVPNHKPKKPGILFYELREPPYGVRDGLLPIFFTAGLKAFSRVVSLMRNGQYVTDIVPDVIEDLCRHPEQYSLAVLDLSDGETKYLRELHACFSPIEDNIVAENDLVRLFHDAIEAWRFQLPSAALTTKELSGRALAFQRLLRGDLDPVKLALEELPRITGHSPEDLDALMHDVRDLKAELESVARAFVEQASRSVRKTLLHGEVKDNRSLMDIAQTWSASIPQSGLPGGIPAVAKGLLARMQADYDSDDLLVEALSLSLVGRPLSRWDDSTKVAFDSRLTDMVHRIEEAALSAVSQPEHKEQWDSIRDLMAQRLDQIVKQLIAIAGPEQAEQMLRDALARHAQGVADGHDD